jgi:glutathione synthase/RimK-type ligase-like ATP-grasp enzyme
MINKNIVLLTDYKGFFGSKQKSRIYRGGMDLLKISELFEAKGYKTKVTRFNWESIDEILQQRPIVLFTSSEDKLALYKSYIDDIIFCLEENDIQTIPGYKFLKAHNNKVFMELIRETSGYNPIKTIHSDIYGSLEQLKEEVRRLKYPVVIKPYSGAMSRGVAVAGNPKDLINKARKVSSSFNIFHDLKEYLRVLKYQSNYKRESFYRNKFIVQNFIPGLTNDWKVLVYNKIFFVLYRGNRKNDFRASGSGRFEFRKDIPEGLLDYVSGIRDHFQVPQISVDVAFDGNTFHLIEFQFLYFGTTTIEKSTFYFKKSDEKWVCKDGKSDLEELYVNSISEYLIEQQL